MEVSYTQMTAAQALEAHRGEISRFTVDAMFAAHPDMKARYSQRGVKYCLEDCQFHLDYLAQAVSANKAELFADYVQWARNLLISYNVPAQDLVVQLEFMGDAVSRHVKPVELIPVILKHLAPAIDQLTAINEGRDLSVPASAELSPLAAEYLDALLSSDRHRAVRLILDAADNGTPVKSLYLDVFQPTQREIGRLWQYNRINVAQEHYCTAVTQHAMAQLYPRIFQGPRSGKVVVAASVSGEMHELGIRMVSDFFEIDGWDSFYLGANTPTSGILQMLKERRAHLLALSATITPHVGHVRDIIRQVRESGMPHLKVLVGGYPFLIAPELWREVGADGFGADAESAVAQANLLVTVLH